jgi:hypothetical protein
VIAPRTLEVNPGTVIRIRIDRPIDLASYSRGEKRRLMEDVHAIMGRNLADLRRRRVPGEEGRDPVFRWVQGRRSGRG